jgi:signal transduction histidine kinase
MNDRGAVGPTAEYPFEIEAAYWQTGWFYLALAAVLLAIIVIINRVYYRFRLKKYLREEQLKRDEALRIKQQMSMDFHDELGNKLAGVMSYSSALRLTSKNPELSDALEYIENSAQEIFYRTKDFIWAIDVESNNLLEVLIYLRDFGVKFFERRKIEFNLRSPLEQSVFDRALADGHNRQIILIFKEAMTNIFKHSAATRVELQASVGKDNTAIISIEDNGHGRINLLTPGHGLRNMKKRAENMKAALEFEKSDLGGLKVRLEFRFLDKKSFLYEKQ